MFYFKSAGNSETSAVFNIGYEGQFIIVFKS